jgi:hypothetical protein
LAFSGGRIFSSAFVAGSSKDTGEVRSNAFVAGAIGTAGRSWALSAASSEAEDSGIGERTGAVAATSRSAATEGSGAAGGAGSLVRGVFMVVSPVNGFLYSVWGVMTLREVGL